MGQFNSGVIGPMGRAFRCVILATMGWLILAAEHPNPPATLERSQADGRVGDALTNIAKTYDEQTKRAESSPESRKCDPGDDQRDSDLCAQWKAADAASEAAWWTKLSGLLSLFGLVGVAGALFLTIRSNRIAQDSSKRQLRAYLGVESIRFEIKSDGRTYEPSNLSVPGTIYKDFVSVCIKNYGGTPASGVSCSVYVEDVPFLGALASNYDYESGVRLRPGANIITRHFLQSGQSETIKSGIGDVRAIWAAERKERSIFVYGRIYYVDSFGEPHSTKFCHVWEPWHPHGERFVPTDKFNGEDRLREQSATG